jgi:hypothetical protein
MTREMHSSGDMPAGHEVPAGHARPAGHDLPADLAEVMTEVLPGGGAFGHRQHVHLAFIAVHRYRAAQTAPTMSRWLRHITSYARAPQKYNATVTRAWSEIVAHHAGADASVTDFAAFAGRHPALLDKRLLSEHYSSAVLASAAARTGWVSPDLAPFPWSP